VFRALKAEDYHSLLGFFETGGWNLCEYSLPSIIVWNHCVYSVHFRIENDLLFFSEIELEKPENKRLLLPLARPFRIPSPAELAGWAAKLGYRQYYYAGGDYLAAAGRDEIEKFFCVREQPGFMDYVYNTADLAALPGRKYSKKRNLLAQFRKQTQETRRVSVERLTPAAAEKCAAFLDRWSAPDETGEQLEMLNCERKAITNGLRHFEMLRLKGVMVSIDEEPAGFAFGGRLSKDTFVLNFEKALGEVKGLYQFLDNEFAKNLPPQYLYINKESDLGKPGLAKAKESYYPCRNVRSYILTIK